MSQSFNDGPAAPRPRDLVASSSLAVHTLPEGTRLLDHEVTGLIGEGGFGIVYLAYDHSLQRRVAIKEYMPSAMAWRANASSGVVVKSDRQLDPFKLGLKSFVNEARLLARFDRPSLVQAYRFWEENSTTSRLRGLLLLDFGAARRVIGDMTHALTVVLKPGFAPIEHYGEGSTMAQSLDRPVRADECGPCGRDRARADVVGRAADGRRARAARRRFRRTGRGGTLARTRCAVQSAGRRAHELDARRGELRQQASGPLISAP